MAMSIPFASTRSAARKMGGERLLSPCLRPRSRADQRIWIWGSSIPPVASDVLLDVRPDEHGTFASLLSVLEQIEKWSLAGHLRHRLSSIRAMIRRSYVTSGEGDTSASHSEFLADSVTLAVMRRISRESVYTAPVIDAAARFLNDVMFSAHRGRRAHVRDVDRLDRPSIKVFARAMLLHTPDQDFTWVWSCASQLTDTPGMEGDAYVDARLRLLQQLAVLLEPVIERTGPTHSLQRPKLAVDGSEHLALSAALALVTQNYDATILLADKLIERGSDEGEGFRIRGLALVNLGSASAAVRDFAQAENLAGTPGRRAHLAYLQGLTEAKRTYAIEASDLHYARGLRALRSAEASRKDDVELERAWLLNGLALNQAILWRRNPPGLDHESEAFALVREAFSLVQRGSTPSRTYLRFNLLANTALLLEMDQRFEAAERIFRAAFESDIGDHVGAESLHRWQATVSYRLGVLQWRDGRMEDAFRSLQIAADANETLGNWATQDYVLRALGQAALSRNFVEKAADTFAKGLALCREARAARGTIEHARGLVASLIAAGDEVGAEDICRRLEEEEGLDIVQDDASLNDVRPSRPPPKLPAYIPEIDLEEIPEVDLNRFLSRSPPRAVQGESRVAQWPR